jgi:hypothetical protein
VKWHVPKQLAGEERVRADITACHRNTPEPITGSYRGDILKACAEASFQGLATTGNGHQRALAERVGRPLKTHCQIIRKTRDANLVRFTTMAIAQWLPSEAVVAKKQARGNNNHGRGPGCKLCGSGGPTSVVETNQHAICECQGGVLPVIRAAVVKRAADRLNAFVSPPHARGMVATDLCRGTVIVRAWFDPARQAKVRICARVSQDAMLELAGYGKYEGFLGVQPKCLLEVLSWAPLKDGLWYRLDLGRAQVRAASLTQDLTQGGIRIWHARCTAMDAWWNSDAGRVHWTAMGDAFAVAARKRTTARLRKAAKAFEKKRKEAKAKAARTKAVKTTRAWLVARRKAKVGAGMNAANMPAGIQAIVSLYDSPTASEAVAATSAVLGEAAGPGPPPSIIAPRRSLRNPQRPQFPDFYSQCRLTEDLALEEADLEERARFARVGRLKLRWY